MKIFGKYILLIAIMGIFASSFKIPMIQVSFELNKGYIIQEYCINKSQPEKKCNGKCHLEKQIEQSQESNNTEKNTITLRTVNWLVSENSDTPLIVASEMIKYYPFRSNLPEGYRNTLMRPPIV